MSYILLAGLALLTIGIWQTFQNGQSSPVISTIGIWGGMITVLLSNWKLGLVLLVIWLVVYFFMKKPSSEKKIRTILRTYKDLKTRFPDKTEDEVCRSVLAMHLDLKYPIRNPDEIMKYISEVFPNALDIDRVCSHLAFSMDMKRTEAGLLIKEKERLAREIKDLKAKML